MVPPVCARHGKEAIYAFACRDVCVAVGTGGPALDVGWWECEQAGQIFLASLLCSRCVEEYHLPPSPASLDDPGFPDGVPPDLLAIPICMRCFDGWRLSRGVVVTGNYPGVC